MLGCVSVGAQCLGQSVGWEGRRGQEVDGPNENSLKRVRVRATSLRKGVHMEVRVGAASLRQGVHMEFYLLS